ncbi:MAG: hypothetical protein WCT40_02650 [Candidatus Magasanikbacteria bacterium]|jgi:hypothetical protein
MFDTSKDVLYIVLSFCIIWVTVFLCWMFYYAGKILKDAARIVEEFRMRLQLLTEAIGYIRGKVESISSLLTLATEGAAGLAKKFAVKKAAEWTEGAMNKTDYHATGFDRAAKEAVDKAVEATAKKMRQTAREMNIK